MWFWSLVSQAARPSLGDLFHALALWRSFVERPAVSEDRLETLLKETCVCSVDSCPDLPAPAEISTTLFRLILVLGVIAAPVFLCGCIVGAALALCKDAVLHAVGWGPAAAAPSRRDSGQPAIAGVATPSTRRS